MDQQGGAPTRRERLLRLSTEVAGLDADLADPLAQERLGALTDALAHALVDLADGASLPSVVTAWPARPTTRRPTRSSAVDVDVASCSALAAALRGVAEVVGEGSGSSRLAARIVDAVEGACAALQEFAQEVASFRAAARRDPLPQEVTTRLQQRLLQAHRLLTPTQDVASQPPTGPRPTTVHP